MNFNGIISERDPVRTRDVIHADLADILDIHCMTIPRSEQVWKLIAELEESSWQAGADEGMAYEQAYGKGAEPE
jgi:hypothetical protein